MRPPAQFSNLDSALLLAATAAWLVSFANYDAGYTRLAWAELGLAFLFLGVFLTRETRRWQWELR
jgi:hypothetical protein